MSGSTDESGRLVSALVKICPDGHDNDPGAPACETCGAALTGIAPTTPPRRVVDRRGEPRRRPRPTNWIEAEAMVGTIEGATQGWWRGYEVTDLPAAQSAAHDVLSAWYADGPFESDSVAVIEWVVSALGVAEAHGVQEPFDLAQRAASVIDAVEAGGHWHWSTGMDVVGAIPSYVAADGDLVIPEGELSTLVLAAVLCTAVAAFATGWRVADVAADPSRLERPRAPRLRQAQPSPSMIAAVAFLPALARDTQNQLAAVDGPDSVDRTRNLMVDDGIIDTEPLLLAAAGQVALSHVLADVCGVGGDHPASFRLVGPSWGRAFGDDEVGVAERRVYELGLATVVSHLGAAVDPVGGWPPDEAIWDAAVQLWDQVDVDLADAVIGALGEIDLRPDGSWGFHDGSEGDLNQLLGRVQAVPDEDWIDEDDEDEVGGVGAVSGWIDDDWLDDELGDSWSDG